MNYIIDIIFVAIVLIFAFLSARKGFVRTAVEVVGFIAAFMLATSVAKPIANFTYDTFIEKTVVTTAQQQAEKEAENTVNSIWNGLPDVIKSGSEKFGFTKDKITEKVTKSASEVSKEKAQEYSDKVIRPGVVKLIAMIVSTILSIVLIIIVKAMAKLANRLFSISMLGRINRTLGFLLGGCKGIIIGVLFCMVIKIFVDISDNGILIFTKDAVSSSHVLKAISSVIPFFS